MICSRRILLLALLLLACAPVHADENPPAFDGQMMSKYLLTQIRAQREAWREDYKQRTTPEAIRAHQQQMKRQFLAAIGGLPERTPLNPQIVETIERPGFRIQKILFESQPNHHVTALLFLPDEQQFPPPYPGIIVPCGHSTEGKANEGYQKGAALAALNGMAAMVFDPIGQGERMQMVDDDGKHKFVGVHEHLMVGVGSILLGENTARFEIADGIRALDYLQSRDDIMADKLGCMGNSGGGTQTAYLMALDDRIHAAAPSCYLTHLTKLIETIGAQDAEQNIFGQLAFGMDHPDYIIMRAPRPTLICAAKQDFFDIEGTRETYQDAKGVYELFDKPEQVDIVEVDAKHGWHQPLREASVRWMAKWLLEKEIEAAEPADLRVLSEQEARVTARGQVLLLPDEVSAYELNRRTNAAQQAGRDMAWRDDAAGQLAKLRASHNVPAWKDIQLRPTWIDQQARDTGGFTERPVVLSPEEGIHLAGWLLMPEFRSRRPVVIVDYAGSSSKGRAADLADQGHPVLSIDLRGTGATQQTKQTYGAPHFGRDVQDFYAAYLLGRSYVAMRAYDVAYAAKWLRQHVGSDEAVELIAIDRAGTPALHAAAFYPEQFGRVQLIRPLKSYSAIVDSGESLDRIMESVHGALTWYDLPNLVEALGEKVELDSPVGPLD